MSEKRRERKAVVGQHSRRRESSQEKSESHMAELSNVVYITQNKYINKIFKNTLI